MWGLGQSGYINVRGKNEHKDSSGETERQWKQALIPEKGIEKNSHTCEETRFSRVSPDFVCQTWLTWLGVE